MTAEVNNRLELSRKELLDLGLRNPLINHRKRAKQVAIVDELATEVYRLLVTEGREFSFNALPELKLKELAERETTETGTTEDIDWVGLLEQPDEGTSGNGLALRHTDTRLQTSFPSDKLQTRLLSIHNDARTYLEEQGVNILFLAIGFLYWYESSSTQEPRRSPLLLVPVELKRASAQERFHVSYTGEEIGDNLSLIEKLKAEFNINLPEISDPEDLDVESYFKSVSKIIKEDERWKVEPDEMTLGFFSFGKFMMYKDLDAKGWPKEMVPVGFNILSSLLFDGFREPESAYGDETHIDEVITPADVHQVKDADSTQILAILDVNAGRNLVLQGPPGTGKSQTITNIIAESIGNGHKTLFVSEKMAALDVVKRRLDEVGLGDAVLELHSHKTNKKQVLEELNRTLHQGRPVVQDPIDDIKTLTQLRDKLNAYCEAVNTPIANTRISFINALGYSIQTNIEGLNLPAFDFTPMADWTESEYRSARMHVETLDRHLAESGSPNKNPFKASQLTEFLPSQRPILEGALQDGKTLTDKLIINSLGLARIMGLQEPENRSDVDVICRAARRAMGAPHLEGLALTSGEWQVRRDDIAVLINAGQQLSKAHARFDKWLIDDAWQQDLVEVRRVYVTKGQKWWRFLSSEYRRAKERMQGLSRNPLPKDASQTIIMIDTVLDSQKYRKSYDGLAQMGSALFGAQWKGEQSDWEVLEKLSEWVISLYRDVGDNVVPEGIVQFLSGSPKLDELRDRVNAVETILSEHGAAARKVAGLLKLRLNEGSAEHWDLTLKSQSTFLGYWQKNIERLYQLVRFNQIAGELKQEGLEFVLSVCKDWDKNAGDLLRLFDYSWYNGLVEKAYRESASIRLFDRVKHAFMMEEFSRLDHLLFQHNQVRLASEHWKSLPKLSGGGELQIISREINKKRRHMPIRKLIGEAGRAIQAIKPVFMMSPMSIATYVPSGALQFDLVVFDEASQVKPVDAFGAILRGKQVVVVGDSKQLPPTSFFDSLNDGSNDEDYESVGDMESILSLFLGKGAPERMLRWHYRSRHDSLIAVSNNEFYNNRLMVFPSPGANPIARGLRLKHLPNTAYDRGKTRSNPEEAKAVAEAVLEHTRTYPNLTLGVVAFSVAQRDAIEFQMELLRREDPTCESFFTVEKREPFFVKNLENVQGDERDVIFISMGYGKTSEGYMTMSFGPINREGGERRLNVLISRARLAMDVFSNFTAKDIDLNRTNARGVVALKNFLAYAENGILEQPYATDKEPDSLFEVAVMKSLKQNGVDVQPQVGTAGFFIDIGVKDPEHPGRYILGIECDGATYHSSRSARDRDRLRQEVLEGLGWRLHRIWSTDWYRSPEKEIERVMLAIQKAKEEFKNAIILSSQANEKITDTTRIHAIKRSTIKHEEIHDDVSGVPYTKANLTLRLNGKELHELSAQVLYEYVEKVVQKESPVHRSEVMRRITEGAGLKRAGSRIQQAVDNAISLGLQQQRINERQGFLWRQDMIEPEVRDRSLLEAASKKLECVSPEEIKQALFKSVESAFSLSPDDAATSAARMLGILRLTAQSKPLFDAQLSIMIKTKVLEQRDGLVFLSNQ